MLRLAARYFMEGEAMVSRSTRSPIPPAQRARLERILAGIHPSGMEQSAGIMVNYRYLRDDIEKSTSLDQGTITSSEVRSLMRRADGGACDASAV